MQGLEAIMVSMMLWKCAGKLAPEEDQTLVRKNRIITTEHSCVIVL